MDVNIIFSEEQCKVLEDDGIFLPCSRSSNRKISGSFLCCPPFSSSSPSSRESIVSVCHHGPATQPDLEVPEEARSAAGLEFIGLTRNTAMRIYSRWESRPEPEGNPDDLIDFVFGDTCQLNRNSWATYSDRRALKAIGIAQWLQDAILDPKHRDIYQTNTLKFWLDESLRANFTSLERIHLQLKAYVDEREKGSSPDSSVKASLQEMTSGNRNFSQPHVNIGAAGPLLEDHEIYYMAKTVDEMSYLRPFISSNGYLDMDATKTPAHWQGDFHSREGAWYWTPELETATKYREYARKRVPASDHWIIRIQVPKDFTSQLNKEELFFSSTWKKYVWYCRRGGRHDPPEDIQKYLEDDDDQLDIMLGHISTGVSKKLLIQKEHVSQADWTEACIPLCGHRDQQHWVRMGEDNVMKVGARTATQWVVLREDVAERLACEIRGKVHIDVYSNGWWEAEN